jgi:hypothetical protein
MENKSNSDINLLQNAAVTLAVSVPSFTVVTKLFGLATIPLYVLVVGLALWFGISNLARLSHHLSERAASLLAVAALAAIMIAFVLMYPRVNTHLAGQGSDADDALNMATAKLLHGDFPYDELTYLDNPISPMPGALVLAAPFVLIGNSAYQNFFWLFVFFVLLRAYSHDSRVALFWCIAILVLSPVVMNQIVAGGDYLANSIYVLVFLLLMVDSDRWQFPRWTTYAFAVLFGISLSSRANFLLLVPLLFATLIRRRGWVQALTLMLISVGVFAAITLPFYLHDPAHFSPLQVQHFKLVRFEYTLAHAGLLIPAAAGVLAVVLAICFSARSTARLLAAAAMVEALPLLSAECLRIIQLHRWDLAYLSYGVIVLVLTTVFATLRWFPGPVPDQQPAGEN